MNAKTRIFIVLLLLVIVGIAVWFFCSDVLLGGKIRNVLLISIDTCRADYLSCYGYPCRITPNIDAVAKESILFENVVVPVPLTLPSHSSMLTGTTPPYHGIHSNLGYRLGDSNVTLAEILKGNGFVTGAVISCFVLDSQFGLNQGFDTYNDKFEEEHYAISISERKGAEASRFALEWLEEHKNEKFFFFLHYFDPHAEYEPPEPFASKFWDNLYAGEIAYTDYCIGQVISKLKDLGLYDSTLIIITGDHGEMLGEQGENGHGYFIYQSALKVPLIFKLPGRHKARRIDSLVGLVDIVPTICSLLGVEPPAEVQGIDLSCCFGRRNLPEKERHLYCESLTPTKYNANSLLGVVTDRWKYIQTTRPELYDIAEDPQESNNLVTKHPQRARILQDRLRQILQEQVRKDSDSKFELDEQGRRRLESLGYVASSVKEDFEFDQSKEDPKDLIDFHASLGEVMLLTSRKKYAEAKELCQKLLADGPAFEGIYSHLSRIAFEEGHKEKAVAYMLEGLKINPNQGDVHNNLGMALLEQGRFEEANHHFTEALRFKPNLVIARNNFAMLFEKQGKTEEVIAHYTESLRLKHNQPEVHIRLGNAFYRLERVDEAIAHWNESLQLNPEKPYAVLNNLGDAYLRQNKLDEAVKHWSESLKLEPNQPGAQNNLGAVLTKQRKYDEAIIHYNESLRLKPEQLDARNNLATALAQQGNLDDAIAHYKESLRLEPNQPGVHKNLAMVLSRQEKLDEAIAHYAEALRLKPEMPAVHNSLAEIYFQQGKFEQAIAHWNEVLQLTPEWTSVLNNLAWCKAAYENEKFHDPNEAVQLAQKACELTGHKEPALLDTLSVAYAAAGRFGQAIETAEKAIELALSSGQNELEEEIQKHLQLYKAGEPYRKLP